MRHWAEKVACEALQRKGLQLIDHNFSTTLGEIDLIMRDGSTLVFIEVRQRRSAAYGLAEETIGHRKQEMISSVASMFSPLTATKRKGPFGGSNLPSNSNM